MNRLFILLIFISGCGSLGRADFVEVVNDHKNITVETCISLIASIDDELDGTTDEDRSAALIDLRDRLVYMSNSSVAIHSYIHATIVDEQLIAELIRNKWKQNR